MRRPDGELSEAAPAPATSARLVVGDSLRGLAAIGVVAVHAVVASLVETGYFAQLQNEALGEAYFVSVFGWLGHPINGLLVTVDLFFVLSAYLLSRPFLRTYIADQPLPAIPGYLRNRALRVLPTFWFVLLVVIAVSGTHGASWQELLGLAGFVEDFQTSGLGLVYGQPWSLSVEVRFYLLLPLAGLTLFLAKHWLGARLPLGARIALVAALVVWGFQVSHGYASRDPLSASFAAHAQFFAPGVLLALLEHVIPDRVRGRRWIGPLALLIFVVGVVLTLASRHIGFHLDAVGGYVVALGTGAIVAGPLLWQWSGRDAWRALDNRVLRWIGERSYPLFLIHSLVIVTLAPHLVVGGYKKTLLVLGPITFAASLLAADLIHRFVERPALRRKHSYATAGPARASTLPAP